MFLGIARKMLHTVMCLTEKTHVYQNFNSSYGFLRKFPRHGWRYGLCLSISDGKVLLCRRCGLHASRFRSGFNIERRWAGGVAHQRRWAWDATPPVNRHHMRRWCIKRNSAAAKTVNVDKLRCDQALSYYCAVRVILCIRTQPLANVSRMLTITVHIRTVTVWYW